MKFGVEIEFKEGVRAPVLPSGWSMTHEPLTYQPRYVPGAELRTSILTSSKDVDKIIDVVSQIKEAYPGQQLTNKHCGMHIHVDKQSVENQINFIGVFAFAEELIFKLHPESRQDNVFCTRIGTESMKRNLLEGRVHLNSYKEHAICEQSRFGTYEIRYGAGRSDRRYIRNWIELVLLIYLLHKEANLNGVSSKEGFLEFLSKSCPDDYIRSRQGAILRWIESKI